MKSARSDRHGSPAQGHVDLQTDQHNTTSGIRSLRCGASVQTPGLRDPRVNGGPEECYRREAIEGGVVAQLAVVVAAPALEGAVILLITPLVSACSAADAHSYLRTRSLHQNEYPGRR